MTDQSLQRIPDHVPDELVWKGDLDAYITATPDPFRRMCDLHEGPEIIWIDKIGSGVGSDSPGWLITRNGLMREVLTDSDHFKSGSEPYMLNVIGLDTPLIPLELNPPHQQRYRKVLEPFFAPASIDALDSSIRETCEDLIAKFENPNGCEFIADFAEQFPSQIFLDLMGMPRSRLQDFLAWERGMLRGETPEEVVGAMTAILEYLQEFLGEQRKNPQSELMKGIVSARLDNGQALTDEEMLSISYILYIGGLDTVYSTIGWIFWHLAQDQPLQDRLRKHPEQIVSATEELLRAFSATSTARTVTQDYDFHGVKMRAGDTVHTFFNLTSRDPDVYENPHVVDIDRKPRHLAFGTGPHTCLGLRLAKREIKIVLETFLSRFRNIRMPEGTRHEYHIGSVFGIDNLPLEWNPV